MGTTGRPGWLSVLIAIGIGAAGQLLISLGLLANGLAGPLVTILAPGMVGLIAALALRNGLGAIGLAMGVLLGLSVASLVNPDLASGDSIDALISVAAALGGYVTGYAITQQSVGPDFMPRPLGPADLARIEADVRGELRAIDPQAPGAFERATVLLRTVSEQTNTFGQWGPRPVNEPTSAPSGLLELQAELLETARVAAIAAGARRVTITSGSMGGGLDIQAVFGDPIGSDEPLRQRVPDVD